MLTKKTTLLFEPDVYLRLVREAKTQRISVGELVRRAVLERYGVAAKPDRVRAVQKLASLSLPVKVREAREERPTGDTRNRG
ncbi:MAG: hypothetical protein ABIH26_02360 [Candidatus Eisenbacteria bacterium]